MADLTVNSISRDSILLTTTAAAGGGDAFLNTGQEFILVENGGVGGITVTIATQATSDGLAIADRSFGVAAGATRLAGPFPTALYNDGEGKVQLTYTGVTSVGVWVGKFTAGGVSPP